MRNIFVLLIGGLLCADVSGAAKDISGGASPTFYYNKSKSTGLSPELNAIYSDGIGLLGDKKWDAAIAKFNDVLRAAPTSAAALGNRGICYLYKSDYDQGIADLKKAIAIDPDLRVPTADSLGIALLDRGKQRIDQSHFDLAQADLNEAAKIPSVRAQSLSELAYIELEKGDMPTCIKQATLSLETNPQWTEALMNRAVCLTTLHRGPEALADLTKVLNMDPSNAGAFLSRAGVYQTLGRCKEAVADAHVAVHLDADLKEGAQATLRACQ